MNKGFSLVELIVVIAIMAILVGVAVPVYTQYIQDAEDSVEEQYIASLESALTTAMVDVKAGLTKNPAGQTLDWTVPTAIDIDATNGLVATATGAGNSTVDCTGFEYIVNSSFKIDKTIAVTIDINANGTVTVTKAAANS